jgi:hypothetical protein
MLTLPQIAKSINSDKKTRESDSKKHTSIYQLAQNIVKGTDIMVTVQLCARIAIMVMFSLHCFCFILIVIEAKCLSQARRRPLLD